MRKVADYLATIFGVRHLDTITTAGLIRHLADTTPRTAALLSDLEVSVGTHGSRKIAVAAHHDCAGNPVPNDTQRRQVATGVARIGKRYPDLEVIGLWLGPHWIVERVHKT